jgi:hypothetical protein
VTGYHFLPLRSSLITGVKVITLGQGNCRWAQELRFEPDHRTSRITQHAIDTHTEILVSSMLGRTLQILTLRHGLFLLANDPGLNALELFNERIQLKNQISENREIRQRLYTNRVRIIIPQKCRAAEFGNPVDHHPATATNSHSARPSECQASIRMILDVVKGVQHNPILAKRDFVGLKPRRFCLFGRITKDFQPNGSIGSAICHRLVLRAASE